MKYDYMDGKSNLFNAYLDGKMLDDNTYAGVLRIPVEDMTVDPYNIWKNKIFVL